MSLVTWKYERRKRQGTGSEAIEQSGDYDKLMQHLIKLSEAHQDFATAAELRAQLSKTPTPGVSVEEPEAVYTPEPTKPQRKRKRKSSPPSTLTEKQRLARAWDALQHER
jgi:hypothetical protein